MKPAAVLPFPASYLPKPAAAGRHNRAPSPDAVRAQLSKILQSEGFIRARRMQRFLEFVVTETLAGNAGRLCEYTIATSVFERDESFEPGLDPIVRNDARRLRQKLLEYYERSSHVEDNRVIIEMPKGSYVPVFTSRSFRSSRANRQYRLIVSLIRIADGAEVWATEHEY
jgi:hypothetical protein